MSCETLTSSFLPMSLLLTNIWRVAIGIAKVSYSTMSLTPVLSGISDNCRPVGFSENRLKNVHTPRQLIDIAPSGIFVPIFISLFVLS